MNQSEFENKVVSVLEELSSVTIEKITKLISNLPEKAESLEFTVLPSQDSDGFFEIQAYVTGPDLYVLQKSIEEYASIIETKFTDKGLEPNFPMVDWESVEFEVNDVIVDCAAEWLKRIWKQIDSREIQIPVEILGDEDYGTTTPIELN